MINVYNTRYGGHVIVRTDANGNVDGWRIPGATSWLTRDLSMVEANIEAEYRLAPADEAERVLSHQLIGDADYDNNDDPAYHRELRADYDNNDDPAYHRELR